MHFIDLRYFQHDATLIKRIPEYLFAQIAGHVLVPALTG